MCKKSIHAIVEEDSVIWKCFVALVIIGVGAACFLILGVMLGA